MDSPRSSQESYASAREHQNQQQATTSTSRRSSAPPFAVSSDRFSSLEVIDRLRSGQTIQDSILGHGYPPAGRRSSNIYKPGRNSYVDYANFHNSAGNGRSLASRGIYDGDRTGFEMELMNSRAREGNGGVSDSGRLGDDRRLYTISSTPTTLSREDGIFEAGNPPHRTYEDYVRDSAEKQKEYAAWRKSVKKSARAAGSSSGFGSGSVNRDIMAENRRSTSDNYNEHNSNLMLGTRTSNISAPNSASASVVGENSTEISRTPEVKAEPNRGTQQANHRRAASYPAALKGFHHPEGTVLFGTDRATADLNSGSLQRRRPTSAGYPVNNHQRRFASGSNRPLFPADQENSYGVASYGNTAARNYRVSPASGGVGMENQRGDIHATAGKAYNQDESPNANNARALQDANHRGEVRNYPKGDDGNSKKKKRVTWADGYGSTNASANQRPSKAPERKKDKKRNRGSLLQVGKRIINGSFFKSAAGLSCLEPSPRAYQPLAHPQRFAQVVRHLSSFADQREIQKLQYAFGAYNAAKVATDEAEEKHAKLRALLPGSFDDPSVPSWSAHAIFDAKKRAAEKAGDDLKAAQQDEAAKGKKLDDLMRSFGLNPEPAKTGPNRRLYEGDVKRE